MSHVLRFGSFEFETSAGQLRKSGLRVRLRDQPSKVLASLLEHPGEWSRASNCNTSSGVTPFSLISRTV